MLAREKKEKKVLKRRSNAVFLVFFVQSTLCKPPNHQREIIQRGGKRKDKKVICDRFQVRSNRFAKRETLMKFRKDKKKAVR
jgi:Pyruvate/2-oxoacid:ferredoxin oxidoreductase gamma subunit